MYDFIRRKNSAYAEAKIKDFVLFTLYCVKASFCLFCSFSGIKILKYHHGVNLK